MPGHREILGKSVEGRDVVCFANFSRDELPDPRGFTLLIGGTHGDERATVPILENFIASHLESGRVKTAVAVIALLNPDGYARDSRYNGRGTDLNRNFPHNWSPSAGEPSGSAPLSEPEARLLHDFILARRPAKIVSLHWALAEIDADGAQSVPLVRYIWDALTPAERLPYRLRLNQGTAEEFCPGSLGQWCGHGLIYPGELRPAMITLELPYHPASEPRPLELPGDHLATAQTWWNTDRAGYLAGVEGPVHRMLEAACDWEHTGDAILEESASEAVPIQAGAKRRGPVRE